MKLLTLILLLTACGTESGSHLASTQKFGGLAENDRIFMNWTYAKNATTAWKFNLRGPMYLTVDLCLERSKAAPSLQCSYPQKNNNESFVSLTRETGKRTSKYYTHSVDTDWDKNLKNYLYSFSGTELDRVAEYTDLKGEPDQYFLLVRLWDSSGFDSQIANRGARLKEIPSAPDLEDPLVVKGDKDVTAKVNFWIEPNK